MIKKIIKTLLIIVLLVATALFYLSFVGIKTERFNERITNKILKINKKINIDLKDVKFILKPFDLSAHISTNNSTILLENHKLQIKKINTNITLNSLIFGKFLIDDLQIITKPIKLNDIILLARSFKNSTELFLLNRIIEDGILTAEIKLKFDEEGKVRDDYHISGFIKDGRFNFLNKFYINKSNFKFNIYKEKYSLSEIKVKFNDVKFSSPLIEIIEKKNLFSIKGKFLTSKKDFNKDQPNIMLFKNLFKSLNIERARFSSINDFSFNINKKLKFNDLSIKSKINLDQLVVNNDIINLKSYLPDLDKAINFENHKITVNYEKDKLEIKGKGEILIKEDSDYINYQIKRNNNQFIFDTKINLKNSELLLDFLNYEKKENLDSLILIKGNFKKNNPVKFDLISLVEKNNKILFKNLNLNKDFKIIDINSFNLNYLNNNNVQNKLFLKRDNANYFIEGENFDATKLIRSINNNDKKEMSLFSNFNSKINLKIKKTYIDKVNFINNLSGKINFKNDKINNLDLKGFFSNNKIINLSIKTNNQKEQITKLYTDYPKPLIERYNFIKGLEEGYLDYYSIKKDEISNSLLIIDDFKVKEVPVFAKILSLASLQGIADLLTGEGIRFTDFEMKFSNTKGLTTIEEIYAIGPAVSIMMDGYIESKKLVSLRGTLVPATTINRSIASIPLLGNILVGKKVGEGVFGVSFKIKGSPKDLKTKVNPVKTLTPRFITRTLEKIKKN